MPKRGGKRVKTRTHRKEAPRGATVLNSSGGQEALAKADNEVPRSIVAKGSKVIPLVGELVRDLRKLMGPYTASNLREKSYNRMKDYSDVAAQLGVTHLLVMTQTTRNIVLRIGRTPSGPTLHFRINKYSLARQVRAAQRRPFESPAAFNTAPLVVLNNFGQADEHHVKLMRVTFQNMFPSINVKTMRLSECRRVVLFHYRKEDGLVDVRHFAIRATPVGINRNIKKLLHSRIPDLGKLQDVAQFLEGSASGYGGAASDSEGEGDPAANVVLPDQFVGKGNGKSQQSAMKLSELGPRMTLEIFKVERGVGEGDVLYHKFEEKTAKEAAATKARIETQRKLKEDRKATQAANVKRKREQEEEKRALKSEAKRLKIESKAARAVDGTSDAVAADYKDEDDDEDDDNDNDAEDDDSLDADDEDNDEDGGSDDEYDEDTQILGDDGNSDHSEVDNEDYLDETDDDT